MSIATRIEDIEQHLTNDYAVLTLAGADLTGINKNILNLKPTWQERLLYFMNNGTQVVWNNWNKVSGTGTTLSINNTVNAPMSLTYKGNTLQNGTPTPSSPQDIHVVSGDNTINVCGKNLLDTNILYQEMYNYSSTDLSRIVVDNRNCIKFKNNSYSSASFYEIGYKENTTYTVRVMARVYDTSITSGYQLYLRIKYTDGTVGSVNVSANGTTWQELRITSNSAKTIKGISFSCGSGTLWLIDEDSFNIIEGDTTTYEAYKGASYTISLGDIELCKIGTYQDKIDKSTGKNLLPLSSNDLTYNRYIGNNGSYQATTSGNYYASEEYIAFTYSGQKITLSTGLEMAYYDKDKTFIRYVSRSASRVETVPNNAEYIRIDCYKDNINEMMINLGETPLPYEPYGTDWYLKKEIGKVVLDGSETTWGDAGISTDTNYYRFTNSAFASLTLANVIYYSNNFKSLGNISGLSVSEEGIANTSTNPRFYLWISKDRVNGTTANDIKTWLGTHNTTVYYVLANPTYETIIDTTLKDQLEEAKKSYESQTNISQTNNDLPFELDCTALGVIA